MQLIFVSSRGTAHMNETSIVTTRFIDFVIVPNLKRFDRCTRASGRTQNAFPSLDMTINANQRAVYQRLAMQTAPNKTAQVFTPPPPSSSTTPNAVPSVSLPAPMILRLLPVIRPLQPLIPLDLLLPLPSPIPLSLGALFPLSLRLRINLHDPVVLAGLVGALVAPFRDPFAGGVVVDHLLARLGRFGFDALLGGEFFPGCLRLRGREGLRGGRGEVSEIDLG